MCDQADISCEIRQTELVLASFQSNLIVVHTPLVVTYSVTTSNTNELCSFAINAKGLIFNWSGCTHANIFFSVGTP